MKKFHEKQSILGSQFILGFFLLLAIPHAVSLAQVTTAITPSGLNTQVGAPTPLPSGQVMHDITGGTRPGNGPNLFHSFGEFSVGTNHTANFLNDSGLATSNILSRVTGGNPSNIFGTLQTTGFGNANLFLMNPAGVVFGPTASLNVGGSVNITTANYVKLADGVRFTALPGPGDALLSVAPVAAFGFLGSDPTGAITVQGGTVEGSRTLSLVGRDLSNGTPGVAVTGGTLSNPSGRINLVSVGTPQNPTAGGEINVGDMSPSSTAGFTSLGGITLSGGATVTTSATASGNNGGTVFIRGGQLTVANSSVMTNSLIPRGDGGSIEVHAGAVTLDQATLSARGANGNGGQIRFMDLDTFSSAKSNLTVDTSGTPIREIRGGGSILVGSPTTTSITLTETKLSSIALLEDFSTPPKSPGEITLTAQTVSIAGGTFSTLSGGRIPGGPITLNADRIAVKNAGFSSGNADAADGGRFTFQGLRSTAGTPTAATAVSIDSSGISDSDSVFPGATIVVHASDLTLNHSNLRLSSSSLGNGPTINLADVGTLTSTGSFVVADSNGTPSIILGSSRTGVINLQDTGITVSNRLYTSATGGNINLTASSVSISGGQITADTRGNMPAGHITANVGTFTLSNGAQISSSSTSTGSNAGNAGTVTITATGAFQSTGSTVNASAKQGAGGQISINAGNLVFDAGSTVSVQSEGAGNAGTIQLNAGTNVIVKESVVSANSKGAGNAGSIQLKAGNNIQVKRSTVSAQSEGTGNVGTIRLEAGHKIEVKDSTITPSPTIVSGQNTK